MNTGRKNTVSIETFKTDDLTVPWVFAPSEVGKKCFLEPNGCSFVKANSGEVDADGFSIEKVLNCDSAVENVNITKSLRGHIVNSFTLRKLGIGYSSPLDYLNITFSLKYISNRSLVSSNTNVRDECEFFLREPSTWVTCLGDDTILTNVVLGNTVNERDIPSPIYIGFGNVAAISYELSQHKFINGTVRNNSEFSTTQFPTRTANSLEIRLLAQSFEVPRINHKEGQSVIDLLGSVFGWVGALTGACVYSLLNNAAVAYSKIEVLDNQKETKISNLENETKEMENETREMREAMRELENETRNIREEMREMRAEMENLRNV